MGISRINRAAPARAQSSEARSAILGQTPVVTSSRFRGILGVALAALIVLTGASVFAGTSAAFAESTPSPAPPATAPAPLPAPTITSPAPGTFVNGTSVRVQGTKAPGTSIQILAGPGQDSLCQVSGDAGTNFDCVVPVSQSGRQYVLTAVQYGGGQTENQRASVTIQALMPPTVNPQSGTTPGPISGKGYPGATVTVASNGNVFATTTVTNAGAWGATIPDSTPSGTYNIQATQAFTPGGAASRPSTSVPIRVEIESIPAPTITSPTNGQNVSPANATYSGTGTDGLTVMVNAGNEQGERLVCTATVSGGRWSCSGAGMPSGAATLIALQTDGKNLPASSIPVSVNYGAASGSGGTPTAPGTPGSTPQAPGTKTPAPTVAPAPGSTATPAPAPATPGQTPSEGATPPGGGGLQENGGTWADSTPFTNALQPTSGVLFTAEWWRAVALAAGAIALLLVPARLLANIVAARISPVRRHGHGISHFTGRNRSAAEFDRAPELPSPGVWVTGAFGIVMTAILVMLANPIEGQPGYLRLLLASVIALLLVNAAGTLMPVVLARWWKAGPATIKLAPRYLIAVAAASALSRLLELQPAILFGLVFTVSLVSVIGAELRGKVALARIAAVFSVGVVGWVATGLIGQPSGFWGALGSEIAGITAMAGVGSAAIMLIPLGQLSGRAIYSWSKPLWMAVTLMMFTALFLQLGPVIDSWQGGVAASVAVLLAVGFGAVSLSLWLWRRYVQPALR